MGVARITFVCGLLLATLVRAKTPTAFRQQIGGAEVDWSAGTITVQAGAAADLRMPNPSAARPGAERRARAAGEAKLQAVLSTLAAGGQVDRQLLSRANVSRIEHQSNGGVVLWLTLAFGDIVSAKPAGIALRVPSMPFTLAPSIAMGSKTAALGVATYRPVDECPQSAIRVAHDAQGRLVLPAAQAQAFDSLAGAAVVIYLEKPQP